MPINETRLDGVSASVNSPSTSEATHPPQAPAAPSATADELADQFGGQLPTVDLQPLAPGAEPSAMAAQRMSRTVRASGGQDQAVRDALHHFGEKNPVAITYALAFIQRQGSASAEEINRAAKANSNDIAQRHAPNLISNEVFDSADAQRLVEAICDHPRFGAIQGRLRTLGADQAALVSNAVNQHFPEKRASLERLSEMQRVELAKMLGCGDNQFYSTVNREDPAHRLAYEIRHPSPAGFFARMFKDLAQMLVALFMFIPSLFGAKTRLPFEEYSFPRDFRRDEGLQVKLQFEQLLERLDD